MPLTKLSRAYHISKKMKNQSQNTTPIESGKFHCFQAGNLYPITSGRWFSSDHISCSELVLQMTNSHWLRTSFISFNSRIVFLKFWIDFCQRIFSSNPEPWAYIDLHEVIKCVHFSGLESTQSKNIASLFMVSKPCQNASDPISGTSKTTKSSGPDPILTESSSSSEIIASYNVGLNPSKSTAFSTSGASPYSELGKLICYFKLSAFTPYCTA